MRPGNGVEHKFLWKVIERFGLFWFHCHEKVLSAYADDVIVLIRKLKDVDVLANLTILFNRLSVARVNGQKSKAHAVGSWINGLPVLPQNLSWRKAESLNYLGVFLGNDTMAKRNCQDITGENRR